MERWREGESKIELRDKKKDLYKVNKVNKLCDVGKSSVTTSQCVSETPSSPSVPATNQNSNPKPDL